MSNVRSFSLGAGLVLLVLLQASASAAAENFDGPWSGNLAIPGGCPGSPPPGRGGSLQMTVSGTKATGQIFGIRVSTFEGSVAPGGAFLGLTDAGRPLSGTFAETEFRGTFVARYADHDCTLTAVLHRGAPDPDAGVYRTTFKLSGRGLVTTVSCRSEVTKGIFVEGRNVRIPGGPLGDCLGTLQDDGSFTASCGRVGAGTMTFSGKISSPTVSGTWNWEMERAAGGWMGVADQVCFGTFSGSKASANAKAGQSARQK
jgi:hypothetical protein